jgi:signal peptide peptidase SppA
MQSPHNPQCFQSHLGPWAIQTEWLTSAVEAVKAGLWQAPTQRQIAIGENSLMSSITCEQTGITVAAQEVGPAKVSGTGLMYATTADGIAVVFLDGPIMKAASKFGGASSIATRQAIRAAVEDPKVNSILLHIDSPGGTAAGTQELYNDIRAADGKKPVYAHIDDLGASAAYWIAAGARRVTANPMAMIGSIGTFAVLKDTSKKMEMEGIKVHVISSGGLKGAGAGGSELTPEAIEEIQQLVNAQNEFFLEAVAMGRKMPMKGVRAVADGRMMMAADAKKAGLIDAVQSLDDVVGSYTEKIRNKKKMRAEHERLGLAIRIQEAE